jgi:hypothetical protein
VPDGDPVRGGEIDARLRFFGTAFLELGRRDLKLHGVLPAIAAHFDETYYWRG